MKKTILAIIVSGTLVAGCAPTTLFYWGDYSSTLYAYKKNPDEKTLKAHMDELQLIMTNAPKNKQLVPPGVYAEYGYFLIKSGKESEGMTYLDKEVQAFPESAQFVDRLKGELGRKAQ